jgi:hypothetical protein
MRFTAKEHTLNYFIVLGMMLLEENSLTSEETLDEAVTMSVISRPTPGRFDQCSLFP